MLLTTTLIQQPVASAAFKIGQGISLFTGIFLIYLLFLSRCPKWIAIILTVLLFFVKAASVVAGSFTELGLLYEFLLLFIYFLFAMQLPQVNISSLRKLMVIICIANLPLMLIQLFGGGAIFHFLRSDFHGDSFTSFIPDAVLFVNDYVPASAVQARPAGFFASNNFFSLFLICTLMLHWRDSIKLQWKTVDFLLIVVTVVCFSKTVFISVFIFILYNILRGNKSDRKYVFKFLIGTGFVFLIYSLLLPGLFLYLSDWENIYLNYALRAYAYFSFLGVENAMSVTSYLSEVRPDAITGDAEESGGLRILSLFTSGFSNGIFLLAGGLIFWFITKMVRKKLVVKKSPQLLKSPEKLQTAQTAKNQILNFSKTSKSPYMAVLVFLPILFGLNFVTSPILWFIFGVFFIPQTNNMDTGKKRKREVFNS
jgi:hypothetical protein